MKRTKQIPKVDLILTSDWHLRESVPECWVGDFEKEQWDSVDFVADLQRQHNCPVLHAGDLFHHWKPSPYLISKAIQHIPHRFYTIYGQHDLPQHNWEERHRSGIYALEQAERLEVLPCVHWNEKPKHASFYLTPNNYGQIKDPVYSILVWHVMNYQGKKPWPGCTDPMAASLLRKYPDYDLILTGDNHKPFTETYKGRLLVNPGSLTRQSAAQIDHRPRVYLYHADSNSVTPVFLPVDPDGVSRDHLQEKEAKEKRFSAFIERLSHEWVAELSFESNLEEFFKANKIRRSVEELTYKMIEP